MDKSAAPYHNGSEGPESQRYRTLYEMLLEAIPSSVLLIDRDLRIVEANRNFLEKNRRLLPFLQEDILEAVKA
jgi:PAS domain-containing protein